MASCSPLRGRWRLIQTGAAPGAYQMALDRYFAAARAQDDMFPTLRLFWWKPPALSLGYHQSMEEVNWRRCADDGVDVVRRPTGGRAILHVNELAYSVVMPVGETGLALSLKWLYAQVHTALVLGLARLGVRAELVSARDGRQVSRAASSFGCFAFTARHEVRAGGRKLIGSALRRYERALLQQGSILLDESHAWLPRYLRGFQGSLNLLTETLRTKTATVSELARRTVTAEEVVPCVVTGFEEVFGAKFVEEPLTLIEEEEVRALMMTPCAAQMAA